MSEQTNKPYEMTEEQKETMREIIELIEQNGGVILMAGYENNETYSEFYSFKGIEKNHAIRVAKDFLNYVTTA